MFWRGNLEFGVRKKQKRQRDWGQTQKHADLGKVTGQLTTVRQREKKACACPSRALLHRLSKKWESGDGPGTESGLQGLLWTMLCSRGGLVG